ncbi:hypothetical protein EBT16_05335, partial [bacterium]|nr:hypothetical protein [bacterium]
GERSEVVIVPLLEEVGPRLEPLEAGVQGWRDSCRDKCFDYLPVRACTVTEGSSPRQLDTMLWWNQFNRMVKSLS